MDKMEEKLQDLETKKEQPKPVIEKLPEGVLKIVNELKNRKNQLVNQFLNISFQVGELKDKQDETRRQAKNINEKITQKIKYAFDKLRLKKRKNYRWQYDGKIDSFVGTLVPERPKVEPKK